MQKIINPLFVSSEPKKVTASKNISITASTPIPAAEDMDSCLIRTSDGKEIPVLVDYSERIVIPVKK